MLSKNIIRPSKSEYSNPIVLVKKRMVILGYALTIVNLISLLLRTGFHFF